jgi:broad specificity phosphatase PhoE
VTEDIVEMSFGDWEGKTAAEITETFGEEAYRLWMEEPDRGLYTQAAIRWLNLPSG